MAVPENGTLKWGSIAMERLTNVYNDYSVPSRGNNVPVFNIFKAGNSGGGATAGSSYPALNSASPGYSPINSAASSTSNMKISLWYGYDQDATSGYTMKRKIEVEDATGELDGESCTTKLTLSGGTPSFLVYDYSTTFGGTVPTTTTTGIATSNKYTTFTSVGWGYSGSTISASGFGFGGDWGMDSVTKNTPSGLNPGPNTSGFPAPLTPFSYSVSSNRGGGFSCLASVGFSMSYTVSAGSTVNFDYDQAIYVN
tara:strand:+ start:912 stop:1673 length:762 start_codon:yes stop_codon:yes gene_type:complete